MKRNTKYFVAIAISIVAGIVLFTTLSQTRRTEAVVSVPARTSPEELAQLANYTRINVRGDFALELTQVQDYSIDYAPLSDDSGELQASVENDTLIISGFGNRNGNDAAVVRIGVPVLDTLEIESLPEITISNFTAPLMNVRLLSYRTFTFQNNVLGNFNLEAKGEGTINLIRNTLTNQSLQVEDGSNVNIISD